MPSLPFGISIIDAVIVIIFVFQILWGARLGFVMATFSLAGEILGLVAAIIYTPTLAKLLDGQFHLVSQIGQNLSHQTKLPGALATSFAQTLFEAGIFFVVFVVVQGVFFFIGKFIHGQIGIRRITYLSNSFFGAFIGVIKATLEVLIFLLAWNMLTNDPQIQQALQAAGSTFDISKGSYLLPIFQHLLPAVSPFTKFF
jgi:uncharacterized membrane protein required for colicin V production